MRISSFFDFGKCGLQVVKHLLAQQHEGLTGSSGGDVCAVDIWAVKEGFADRARRRPRIAEEVISFLRDPCFQRGGVKAGTDGGVEEHLAVAQRRKLLLLKQEHIFVEAGEDDLALPEQLIERFEGHSLGVWLGCAGKIGDFGAQKLQRLGDHSSGDTQTDDTHPQTGDLRRFVMQHGHAEAMKQADQLMEHVFDHATVAVIADAQHANAKLPGARDVHVGAFF